MQFARVNNIYFLIISILAIFPFSPKTPYTLGGTFAAVLIFTMLKEAYEDIARHRQDTEVNTKSVYKYFYDKKAFDVIQSQEVQVGDIIRITDNEAFPADLIMIANSNTKGIAYVNTMNLDGETNLKEKTLFIGMTEHKIEEELDTYKATYIMDKPNSSLVKWNCNIRINDLYEPLDMKQLLLRGCVLKNTD